MYYVLAIIGFSVLIFVHELGHFIAAKSCGVKVLEFSMGMGPTLLKKQGRETQYSLRLLPIGGFCAMEGEDEDTGEPGSFSAAAPWKRFIILISGVGMNFLLGFLLIALVYSSAAAFNAPIIDSFMDGCPYEASGLLHTGDEFYSIDGHRTWFTNDVTNYMNRGGSRHDLVMLRDGKKVRFEDMELTAQVPYTDADGNKSLKYGFNFGTAPGTAANKIKYSWFSSLNCVRLVWQSLVDIVTGEVSVRELSGVVGIVDAANTMGKESASFADALENIMYLFALIAINLAVFNLLPLPALDGGRVFFLIITSLVMFVSGKKINPKYEGYVNTAGLALFMVLMVVVMFNDIWRIITR